MPHPVHRLLQRLLETQQYAFDPRERALFDRPQSQARKAAPEPARKAAYGQLGFRN